MSHAGGWESCSQEASLPPARTTISHLKAAFTVSSNQRLNCLGRGGGMRLLGYRIPSAGWVAGYSRTFPPQDWGDFLPEASEEPVPKRSLLRRSSASQDSWTPRAVIAWGVPSKYQTGPTLLSFFKQNKASKVLCPM